MIDTERAGKIAATLAADGYLMEIAEAGRRVRVTITATPQACADCLVPQDMMRGILGQAFGVPRDAIDLTYPSTSEEEKRRGSHGPQDQPSVPRRSCRQPAAA